MFVTKIGTNFFFLAFSTVFCDVIEDNDKNLDKEMGNLILEITEARPKER